MNNKQNVLIITLLIIVTFGNFSCSWDTIENNNESGQFASCENCHTNYAHLQEVYSPDTTEAVGGCGGGAPHIEPYDRVFMGDEGYESYKESGHYALGCVGCHNGTDNTADKVVAHSGDFISHPSVFMEDKCAGCHASEVNNFKTSKFIKNFYI